MAILSGFLLVVFIVTAVLLVIIVLMQDEQGDGLGGIFGGGGAAPVGNRSGNILTRATAIIATIFLVSLFGYAWLNRTPDQSNVEAAARALEQQNGNVLEWWRTDTPVNVQDATGTTTESALQPSDASANGNGTTSAGGTGATATDSSAGTTGANSATDSTQSGQ